MGWFKKLFCQEVGQKDVCEIKPSEVKSEWDKLVTFFNSYKEHNDRIFTKWIEEGKIKEPVISFCNTVLSNPRRFKHLQKFIFNNHEGHEEIFEDKLTGEVFKYSFNRHMVSYVTMNRTDIKRGFYSEYNCNLRNKDCAFINYEFFVGKKLGDSSIVICNKGEHSISFMPSLSVTNPLITVEEGEYIYHKLYLGLKDFYAQRNSRLRQLKEIRKQRAINKERERLTKIYQEGCLVWN